MTLGALEDKYAFEDIQKLAEKFNIKRIIETGTYKGWSTNRLCDLGVPVETIEVDESNFKEAKSFLSSRDNVKMYHGSSPEILETILEDGEENLLFFLDAHWYEYWPLKDELRVIAEKNIKPVISIHDFYVPNGINNEGKFGFDSWVDKETNEFKQLDLDYIKESLEKIFGEKYEYHYNSQFDSVDRGLIYIYPI
jgi:hypothetical protein